MCGDALFADLLQTVAAFDQHLRDGFSEAELAVLRDLLARLRTNVTAASGSTSTG